MFSDIAKTKSPRFEVQEALMRVADDAARVSDALAPAGLSIENLIYENSKSLAWEGAQPASLAGFEKVGKGVPIVSFFTGCGGMDLGFEAVGFNQVAAFDFSEVFCQTLRSNRPRWKVFGPPIHPGDLSKPNEVADALSPLFSGFFGGVFVGGPPCQPFSIAASQRFSKSSQHFKRVGFGHTQNGNLLFDFVELVIGFMPAVFVIENVTGLRDLDGGKQLSLVISKLAAAGYKINGPSGYDASNHGVPQYRYRLFIVGSRLPGKLAPPKMQRPVGSGSVLSTQPGSEAANHEVRDHKVGSVARYMRLDYGQRDQLGRVDRLDPTKPSKTVIAGGSNGGGRSHLHPEIPRTLSVRECARLQTFPDDYKFTGSTARQFTQVGNAVPPVLAAALATEIAKAYF